MRQSERNGVITMRDQLQLVPPASNEQQLISPPNPAPTKVQMTHAQCVKSAASWLQGKCDVVLPEFFTWNSELPDVIGFDYRYSTLIECKISRADFLRDKKKPCRNLDHPDSGMGNFRYYCCPKGLIRLDELPDKWGLIYIYPSGFVKRVKEALYLPKDIKSEHHLLFYYARRAQQAGVHQSILAHRVGVA